MKKTLFVILLILIALPTMAQRKRNKPKNSHARGTLDFYWGYNHSAYTKSDLQLIGEGYDFTLSNVAAEDRPVPFSSVYFNPTKITIPQFNIRLGYNFWNNFNLSLGYDHMKYVIRNNQDVSINGYVTPGIDEQWSGNYNGETVPLNDKHFHYENSDGLNYIRLQLTRVDQWYRTKKTGWFAINSLMGVSTGMVLSFNDLNFAGDFTRRTISASGYGISGHLGVRFEFWRHLFVQTNLAGGFIHQVNVKTRPTGTDHAKQRFGYIASETVVGFLFYIRPTNDCNSCPHW
jgi:opacity protein-like surface antigen